jgi:hypothetical protein
LSAFRRFSAPLNHILLIWSSPRREASYTTTDVVQLVALLRQIKLHTFARSATRSAK